MSSKYILDENGEPAVCHDTIAWATWFENADRRIAIDFLEPYVISTVFLGLDYGFGFQKGPVVWETMVFKGDESMFFDRCSGSREQAQAMHEAMKARMQEEARILHNNCDKLTHGLTG